MEENKKYSIKLYDGTILSDLTLNGTNFVSDEEVDPSIFDGNLVEVTISDGINEVVHTNMELVGINKYDDQWYIALIDIPENILKEQKLRSDVDYIAMMTDIDI